MQLMHIRLSDKHNVVNHFCLQAFLSEQSFPSLSMSCCSSFFYYYFVVFQGQIAARSNFIPAGGLRSGFFLPVILVHDTEYFPLQGLSRLSIQISYHVNFCDVLPFYLMRMFFNLSFLVCCRWSLNTLYTVVHKLLLVLLISKLVL